MALHKSEAMCFHGRRHAPPPGGFQITVGGITISVESMIKDLGLVLESIEPRETLSTFGSLVGGRQTRVHLGGQTPPAGGYTRWLCGPWPSTALLCGHWTWCGGQLGPCSRPRASCPFRLSVDIARSPGKLQTSLPDYRQGISQFNLVFQIYFIQVWISIMLFQIICYISQKTLCYI